METILVADDSNSDLQALEQTFRNAKIVNPIRGVNFGQEAIAYLAGQSGYADRTAFPFPGIVFVDLVMPQTSGLDILRWIQSQPDGALKSLAIVVMTGMGNIAEIRQAYLHGAHSFLIKPIVNEDFMNLLHGHVGICVEETAAGRVLHFDKTYFRRR
jgi:CheY-like chemotaxis protein